MNYPPKAVQGFQRGSEKSFGNGVSELLSHPAPEGNSQNFRLIDWSSLDRGTLKGFATVQMPSGMILHDCPVFRAPDGRWSAIPPSKPLLRQNVQVLDGANKPRFVPVISFATKQHRDKWSDAVVAALRARPEVFGGS